MSSKPYLNVKGPLHQIKFWPWLKKNREKNLVKIKKHNLKKMTNKIKNKMKIMKIMKKNKKRSPRRRIKRKTGRKNNKLKNKMKKMKSKKKKRSQRKRARKRKSQKGKRRERKSRKRTEMMKTSDINVLNRYSEYYFDILIDYFNIYKQWLWRHNCVCLVNGKSILVRGLDTSLRTENLISFYPNEPNAWGLGNSSSSFRKIKAQRLRWTTAWRRLHKKIKQSDQAKLKRKKAFKK